MTEVPAALVCATDVIFPIFAVLLILQGSPTQALMQKARFLFQVGLQRDLRLFCGFFSALKKHWQSK